MTARIRSAGSGRYLLGTTRRIWESDNTLYMNNQRYIPEVKFELAPIELEAEYLYFFSRTERRFGSAMNRIYPELDGLIEKTKNKDEAILKCREFAKNMIEKNKATILKAKDMIQNDWDTVSNEFLETLAEHFQTEWPRDKSTITGYISILPAFPRFLDKYSFCVGYKVSTALAREIIAHEILHFLWFKKWKEVFPEIPSDQYESPNLTWRLSEIMDLGILQCNPEMKSLIRSTGWGYDSLKALKIGDIGVIEYFVEVYTKCVHEGQSFEQILRTLWKEAQENKEVIEKF